MTKCFFCAAEIGLLETRYVIRWQSERGARWSRIGFACEPCGEKKVCSFTSENKPERKND